jgi:2-oxoisovalerate dehydrogenase E1 component beta subunit
MPRSPIQAKGLLLSAILESENPVIFMEPKILYQAAIKEIPDKFYTLPLSKAKILKPGANLTVILYGRPLYICSVAIEAAEKDFKDTSIKLIDLQTIYLWDRQTILESVYRTGHTIIVHKSMVNFRVRAEVAATIQERAFLYLKAPIKQIAGWTTYTGLAYEKFILPDIARKYYFSHLLYTRFTSEVILTVF